MATKKYVSLERLTEYDALIKAEIAEGDESVKAYVDTSISNITNGTIAVKDAEHADTADNATSAETANEATHAISADSAIKATQDGNSNVITETYETKTDASAKLDEAKEYTDTAISSITTITNDEIDEICSFVTEGSLLQTDVDELMAQLED